jgi:hypothetical protein
MAEGKPVVSILRELEFEIVKECWNTYVLADQTRVKGRIILVKLLADKTPLFTVSPTGPSQQAAVKPVFTHVFAISAPLNMKGKPGNPPTQEEISTTHLRGQLVEIVESNEGWNTYRIVESGETLSVKMNVAYAYRIPGRYDPDGEPLYIMTHTFSIVPGPRSNLPRP